MNMGLRSTGALSGCLRSKVVGTIARRKAYKGSAFGPGKCEGALGTPNISEEGDKDVGDLLKLAFGALQRSPAPKGNDPPRSLMGPNGAPIRFLPIRRTQPTPPGMPDCCCTLSCFPKHIDPTYFETPGSHVRFCHGDATVKTTKQTKAKKSAT